MACVCCFQTPVIALVGNDACWSQIAREQVPMFGSNVACGLEVNGFTSVPFKIASVLGTVCRGREISELLKFHCFLNSIYSCINNKDCVWRG